VLKITDAGTRRWAQSQTFSFCSSSSENRNASWSRTSCIVKTQKKKKEKKVFETDSGHSPNEVSRNEQALLTVVKVLRVYEG
jgi:hypothetical protein